MPSPICFECGTSISGDLIACFHRCESCLEKLRSRPKMLNAPTGLVVRVAFSPGYTRDRTDWETSFFSDGTVKQAIRWFEPVHGDAHPPELTASISKEDVTHIQAVLASVDVGGLAVLKRSFGVRDASWVYLFAPSHGINVGLPWYCYDEESIPTVARRAADNYEQAWDLFDSLSPYSVITGLRTPPE